MDNKNPYTPFGENNDPKPEKENETSPLSEGKSVFSEDGSYEIVFGADRKRDDTRYSAGGYNAYGFNANGSTAYRPNDSASAFHNGAPQNPQTPQAAKKQKNRVGTASVVLLIVASVFFLLSTVLLVSSLLLLTSDKPDVTLSPQPDVTEPLEPWVNPGNLTSADAYANAAAKTVNSVVVISATSNNASSSGSGVIWASGDSFSYILTCNHVIENQSEIQVTLNKDESYYAELVGADARTDIAILKIDATGLPAITLPAEDFELALGQAVIAIGNPLGVLGNSVTNGILSSLGRIITVEGTTMEVIQTNAAVNSGNSGGGLFDMNGQLIGMVNAKVGQTAVEGIGFAIPFDTLKTISEELIKQGYVSGRPKIGITTVTIDSTSSYNAALREYPDLEAYVTQKGWFQTTIVPGVYVVDASGVVSYGDDSDKFAFGDRITAIGGKSIDSDNDLNSALNDYAAGDTIQITVARQNKSILIELVLGEKGK